MISAPSIRHRQRRASREGRGSGITITWQRFHRAAWCEGPRVRTDPSARKHGHLPSDVIEVISPQCDSDHGFCLIVLNVMLAATQSLE